jgi:hypothetical protein
MIRLKLPFWLDGPQLAKLTAGAQAWWEQAEGWLTWMQGQFDPLTCPVPLLNLLAYQRDVRRFTGESEALYRKRVKFAYLNAADAGYKAGFERIFERLGLGYVEQIERFDAVNWDVIGLVLSDATLAENPELLRQIVTTYGRTCRRYEFTTIAPLPISAPAFAVGHVYSYDVATI